MVSLQGGNEVLIYSRESSRDRSWADNTRHKMLHLFTDATGSYYLCLCCVCGKFVFDCHDIARFPCDITAFFGAVVWNSLPAAVCEADSLRSFKRKLKTRLFILCFND